MSRAIFPVIAALTLQGCLSEIGRLIPEPSLGPAQLGAPCTLCDEDGLLGCFPGRWTHGPGALTCVEQGGEP